MHDGGLSSTAEMFFFHEILWAIRFNAGVLKSVLETAATPLNSSSLFLSLSPNDLLPSPGNYALSKRLHSRRDL
jgi:hypothetical protein